MCTKNQHHLKHTNKYGIEYMCVVFMNVHVATKAIENIFDISININKYQ